MCGVTAEAGVPVKVPGLPFPVAHRGESKQFLSSSRVAHGLEILVRGNNLAGGRSVES